MKTIFSLFIVMHLVACAGAYQPTEKSQNLQRSMSYEQAITTLETALTPSDKSFGLCARATGVPGITAATADGDTIKFITNGFEIHGEKRGKQIGTETRYGEEYAVYETTPLIKRHLYSELSKIRIKPVSRSALSIPICGGAKGDILVMLHLSSLSTAYIDVPQEDLDKIVAALTVLSPDIEILEGVGF